MGRKNVPEDRRSDTASEQGIPAKLFDRSRNKDAGFTENGKAETNGTWNFSADFWNGRPFMTGIRQVFRGGTIIVSGGSIWGTEK